MRLNIRNTLRLLLLACPLALAGCLSFSSSSPPHPANTTVVVPPSGAAVVPPGTATIVSPGTTTTVVCTNGAAPPC